ncbi:hypothetical protein ACQPW1_46620 [Nocardia sp. CA-128927]|uniref:hypothetical protein n=1 Tax=Nocardia sp. CA-128927 TaxID=3239975 RepID=UPI003D97BDEE
MTTFATLIAVAVFGYPIYRYMPRGAERAFRLERFHPSTPMSDWTSSYYDDQRRYSDLAAIYGRRDLPDVEPTGVQASTSAAPQAVPAATPKPAAAESTRQTGETQLTEYAWRSRRTVAHSAGETRRPAKGVRRLVTDTSTLDSKAS